jgi:virulence factor
MIKLGILDFDTSHVIAFTTRLNHKDKDKEQWVDGAEVVIGCPGESKIMPERIPGYKKEMENLGVPLVDKPEEMIGKVDGMLIESQEGGVHWERARPFVEAGIPCFVDKPFACSVADARKMMELAASKKVALFSSSSLRYAPELVEFMSEAKLGKVLGAVAYGPAHINEKDPKRNPGLFHYGIHAVEVLYTLMGPGCRQVTCTHEKDVDVVAGQWKDGRVATVRGVRGPAALKSADNHGTPQKVEA